MYIMDEIESVAKDVIEVNAKRGTQWFSLKHDEGSDFIAMSSIEKTSRNIAVSVINF